MLQGVTAETPLQALKFTIEDSVQYHHTVTKRDRDIQDQFSQYSDRMADCEVKMNQWQLRFISFNPLGVQGTKEVSSSSPIWDIVLPMLKTGPCMQRLSLEALGTIKLYIETNDKVRVVRLGL